MAQRLPRFRPELERQQDEKLDRVIEEAEVAATTGATAGGDWRRRRGVPIVGKGTGGTSPGTDPLTVALRRC